MTCCGKIRFFVLLMACVALSACGVIKPPREKNEPAKQITVNIVEPLGSDEILSRISKLPGQTLNNGTCGLFLWLRRDDAPLIFFQKSDIIDASMILDGSVQALKRQTAAGVIGFNFFENQTFQNAEFTLSVSAKAEAVRTIRQGIKIESGSISITASNGWSASLPVAGVIGCK